MNAQKMLIEDRALGGGPLLSASKRAEKRGNSSKVPFYRGKM